jgi:hypothetical protein
MPWSIDARIPLATVHDEAALAASLAEGRPAAVLAEGAAPESLAGVVAVEVFDAFAPAHALGCACCAGRSAAAAALDRLFQARVRGGCAWFERVVALAPGAAAQAEVAAALAGDALTKARFRAG